MLGVVASFRGDMKAALGHFTAARDALAPYAPDYPDLATRWRVFDEATGIAAMRQGEIDNCLVMTGSDRCLFPLRPEGRHRDMAGATQAFERFRELAGRDPANLETRWLLNLSAMLTGRHPEGVPPALLLPASVFRSRTAVPRFAEVARDTGLGRMDIAGGTITDDFDNDGDLDVVFTTVDYCSPARLYVNKGDGTFEDRTEAAGLAGQLGGLNASHTDYNNDGLPRSLHPSRRVGDCHAQLAPAQQRRRHVHRRDEGGRPVERRVRDAFGGVGRLTTTTAGSISSSDTSSRRAQLFRNRGDGTFVNVSVKAGVAGDAFTKGVVWGDYDNDGFADLYVSNMFGDNFLYRNNGNGTFTELGPEAGRAAAVRELPDLFVRLRQRRLARPLRRVLLRTRSRSS